MLVSCPTCPAEYEIAESDLGAEGRVVECSACGARWMQPAPAPLAPGAPSTIPGLAQAKRSLDDMNDEDAPGLKIESLYGDDNDDAEDIAAVPDPVPAPAPIAPAAPTPLRRTGGGPDLSPARPIEDVAIDPDDAPRRSARRGGDLPDAARLNAELRASAHEEERVERRRRSGFRTGLMLVLIIGGIGAGLYHGRDKIVELLPQAEQPLDGYIASVDDGKAQAMVWIDQAIAKIKPMIGGEAPATMPEPSAPTAAPTAAPAPEPTTEAPAPEAAAPETPTTTTTPQAPGAAAPEAPVASGTSAPAPSPMAPPAMTAPSAPN